MSGGADDRERDLPGPAPTPAGPQNGAAGAASPASRETRYHPLFELVRARLLEFRREPAAIFWVYVFPLIMVVALGIAFRSRPADSAKVVVLEGPLAAGIARELNETGRFDAVVLDDAECRRQLRVGKAALLIEAAEPSSGEPQYTYVFDPSRPESQFARDAADDVLQRAAGRRDVVVTQSREFLEPGGRYIDFLVPGLIGMGLMGGGMWGVGFAIVDMRIRKLLKRYLATPMKRSQFLGAIMLSRLLFTIPEIVVLLVFSRLLFGVTNQGSYLALAGMILLGAVQFAGIGLLVASRAQTLETVSGLMNATMLPMWLASGIFFSVDRFPDVLQPLIAILPLTPLINCLRGLMLEGASILSLGPDIGIMAAWSLVTFALALRWFRWN